ncbi:peptidylprolyl isomerase [Virgibacillus sp. W0181]|uniref:peptidylprolyl isomerase n=1 Tax=Virgibacillus sp. W0181 TaxID=3391581 RepID=UPI003F483F46
MPKKLLLSIILTLIVLNIVTLLLWKKSDNVALDDLEKTINRKDPVAVVGKKKVTYEDWMETLRDRYGKAELEEMINQSVVRQLAKENKIKVDKKVIEFELANIMTTQGVLTKEEMKAAEEKWRKNITHRYKQEALLTKDIRVTEEEVEAYYEEYANQYSFSESVQISHITVDGMETAEKVMEELNQGASFPLLALEYSSDEATRQNGGYMGYLDISSDHLLPSYKEAIINMEENTHSSPVKLGDEAAIIYLHRHLPEIKFTYEEIKPYIQNELALKKKGQTLDAGILWNELEIDWIYE